MIEFTTKFEEVDRPLTPDEIISNKWLTEKEIAYLTEITRKINEIMSKKLLEKGIILAD
ncbi:MAG TPA: phosphoribosylaminoimidazolesuccinocarboxamide synthase, partial [Methanosarcinales archaeon]|nr:phosphoribosylaminoimidazolesuccinocarboxamide synthase [Methanosarcinales archaeon]